MVSTPARRGQPPERLGVRKTYTLFVDGTFPRSESGRTYPVTDARGAFLANAARASRKDARDAVAAARAAFPGWSRATADNRGQVLYRVAEVMEGRHAQFAAEVSQAEGCDPGQGSTTVDAAIDRWVWYAGWADKLTQVAGAANPVAGPYVHLSVPQPTGVVAVLAPQRSSLLGLVSVLAPVLAGGNTCVLLASQHRPLPAVTLAEVLATSDVPAGVVNLLTGSTAEVAVWLASHEDVNALDLAGAAGAEGVDWGALEATAASALARVLRPAGRGPASAPDGAVEPDYTGVQDGRPDSWQDGPGRILAFMETKTIWHPKGR